MFWVCLSISSNMSVHAVSGSSSSFPAQAAREAERTMLVMKKQQDVTVDQGKALVELVNESAASGIGQRINVYA